MMILTLTWIEKIFVNLWTNKKQDNRMGKKILSFDNGVAACLFKC